MSCYYYRITNYNNTQEGYYKWTGCTDIVSVSTINPLETEYLCAKDLSVESYSAPLDIVFVGLCPSTTPTPTFTPTPTQTPAPIPSFISVWTASSPIELPYSPTGTYSGTIDWGDGNISANTYANRTHNYALSGDYTVTITGVIEGWNFDSYASSYANSLKEILQWGPLRGEGNSNEYMFYNCQNLVLTDVTDVPNLVGVTSTSNMFYGCISLTTINNINN